MERLIISPSRPQAGKDGVHIATRKKSWKFDLQIPVAVVGATLLQTAAVVWWAATMDRRVSDIERQIAIYSRDSERLIRIEERLGFLSEQVRELGKKNNL